jgi:hypothetical protein
LEEILRKLLATLSVLALTFTAAHSMADTAKRNPAQDTPSCQESIAKQIQSAHPEDHLLQGCWGSTVTFNHKSAGEVHFNCGCKPPGPGEMACFAIISDQYTFEVNTRNCTVTESRAITYTPPQINQ